MSRSQTFEQWLAKVDAILIATTGAFDSGDLIDFPYRDAYDDGVPPRRVADAVLRENGWPL